MTAFETRDSTTHMLHCPTGLELVSLLHHWEDMLLRGQYCFTTLSITIHLVKNHLQLISTPLHTCKHALMLIELHGLNVLNYVHPCSLSENLKLAHK
jgi:hypothetical protein